MKSIAEILPESPFFAGLDEDVLELIAGCGTNVALDAGAFLFREGQPAGTFFLVRHGRVALELHSPSTGTIIVDTADPGEVVGWSWLVPPHRWLFDARAASPTAAIAFDGVCLRAKCDADPRVGYALLQRVAHVMYERLAAARIRLLDMYGHGAVRDVAAR